jgi:hypothetical protein
MEGWKAGRLEGWKAGRLEGWKERLPLLRPQAVVADRSRFSAHPAVTPSRLPGFQASSLPSFQPSMLHGL